MTGLVVVGVIVGVVGIVVLVFGVIARVVFGVVNGSVWLE